MTLFFRRLLPLTVLMALAIGLVAGRRGAPQADSTIISPAVQAALDAGDEQTVHRVWVHFAPRALAGQDLAAALDAAAARLSPRTAARRARMPWPDGRLVDRHDLPLDPQRLAACRAAGAELRRQSRWLNAASFRADRAQLARLSRLPGVARITLVGGTRPAAVPDPVGAPVDLGRRPGDGPAKTTAIDYGANLAAMQQLNVVAAHDMGLSGAGVVVGMLDTGFRVSHEALRGVPVLAAWDFVGDDANVDTEAGDPASSHNHGTMTLSTVAGDGPGQLVAPAYGVSVILARTEDVAVEVPVEEDNWVAGLEWAEGLGADIISSSLGYVDWYDAADLDGATAVTTIAADLAVARGLVVVTAAGNDRQTTGHLIAPGDAHTVVTVGAVDANGNTASFSSPGPTADGRIKPDVAALGVANTVADPTNDTNYLAASGTSFATPLTAGVVALMLERVPALTPLQVSEALRATASRSSAPDNDQGWGIIDAAAAVTWFGPVIEHTPLPAVTGATTPYVVTAAVNDRLGVDAATVQVRYRIDGGAWQVEPLIGGEVPGSFSGEIPGQSLQSQVDYYLVAASVDGVATSFPYPGAAAPLTFFVSGSSTAPGDPVPAGFRLEANVPNPFNPRTEIRFRLDRPGPATLRVFDLQGRLVRTLLAADLPAGPHTADWDGRDAAGRAVASGTYLCRLTGGGEAAQRKLQLVR